MTTKEKAADPVIKDKLHKANIRMSYLASYLIREYNHVAINSWNNKDSIGLVYTSKDKKIEFNIEVFEDLKCKWWVLDKSTPTRHNIIAESEFTNYNFKTGYAYILKQNEETK